MVRKMEQAVVILRDTRNELAEAGHIFALNNLLLGLLERSLRSGKRCFLGLKRLLSVLKTLTVSCELLSSTAKRLLGDGLAANLVVDEPAQDNPGNN